MNRENQETRESGPAGPRVVFDCMLFLQATARSSGPAAAALREWQAGAFTLYVSQPVLEEVRDVLALD